MFTKHISDKHRNESGEYVLKNHYKLETKQKWTEIIHRACECKTFSDVLFKKKIDTRNCTFSKIIKDNHVGKK